MTMKKGKLIVFEGISGTGKETQAKLLEEYLSRKNINSRIVYHPSSDLKEILSSWRKDRLIDNVTEVYLLLADRLSRVNQIIKPMLDQGVWIISLRNYVSALVYQGQTDKERLWIKKEFAGFEPKADRLFYFDIDPESAYQRTISRHNKTGEPMGKFETLELLAQKRKSYLEVLSLISFHSVDASQDIDSIHKEIISNLPDSI